MNLSPTPEGSSRQEAGLRRREFLLDGAKAGFAFLAWDALSLPLAAEIGSEGPSKLRFPLMATRPYDASHLTPYTSLYREGVRLLRVAATCSEDIYLPELRAWTAAGKFDYAPQEAYWRRLLAQCPEAKLCLRVYVGPPPWWDEAHAGELQRYADGRVEHTFQRTNRRTLPSLASEVWRRDRGDWCSLYGPCAGLTAPQLARIAEQAGVHLYGPPPLQVTASEERICAHVNRAGRYVLRLPVGEWRDLFTGKATRDGTFDFPDAGVALFVRSAVAAGDTPA